MSRFNVVLAAAISAIAANQVHAADATEGRNKAAAVCQVCHGLDGISKRPDAPHLAGQPEIYLTKVLSEFQRGVRKHEIMSVVAKQLSEKDIQDVAAWYASIEFSAKLPAR